MKFTPTRILQGLLCVIGNSVGLAWLEEKKSRTPDLPRSQFGGEYFSRATPVDGEQRAESPTVPVGRDRAVYGRIFTAG